MIVPEEAVMRGIRSGGTRLGTRRTWEPPSVTKLAIGTETKSAKMKGRGMARGMASDAAGAGERTLAQPTAPAAPSTKMGFSIEMAFPLAARTEK